MRTRGRHGRLHALERPREGPAGRAWIWVERDWERITVLSEPPVWCFVKANRDIRVLWPESVLGPRWGEVVSI